SRAELYQLNPGHRGDHIDPTSPRRILIPADLSPSADEKLKKLSGSGGLSASSASNLPKNTTPVVPTKAAPPVLNAKTITPAKQTPPVLASTRPATTAPVVTTANTVAQTTKKISTPRGSSALASFAAQSDLPIPSAPRIPVAVTPAAPAKQIQVEPPISAAERQQVQQVVTAQETDKTVDDVLQPVATPAEQAQVVEELKALAPAGTEIVDPYDGKIKLTAIQTSLSVAEQQGKELTKGISYPKEVADSTTATSVEAQLNQGKNYVKDDSEVVVVAAKGKRSTYKVLPGDNLARIAAKNGVNWRDVAKWNQIDPNSTLYVGTTIYLYDAKPVQEQTKAKEKPESYVVQANDSLTSVASQFGLSLKQLADFNGLSTNSGLFVGQKLSLKETAASKAKVEDAKKAEAAKVQTKSYTVKRGEYLKLIADRYGLSNAELASFTSGLTAGSSLMVGQKINVPLQEVEALTASTQ